MTADSMLAHVLLLGIMMHASVYTGVCVCVCAYEYLCVHVMHVLIYV